MSEKTPQYSDLWVKARARMQLQFGQSEIISVQKWLVQWTGDYPAAILLNQILYYSSRKPNGWFWKTYNQWSDELLLPERVTRRCRKTIEQLDCGLETKVKQVNGAPTLHWRIDPEKFWAAVDRFIADLSKGQMDLSNTQNGTLPNVSFESDESAETEGDSDPDGSSGSITREEQTKETNTPPLPPPPADKRNAEGSGGGEAPTQPPSPVSDPPVESPPRRAAPKPSPPPSRPRNHRLEAVAYFAYDVKEGPYPKQMCARIGKALKAVDEAFPDPKLNQDDLANAYLFSKERGQIAPRDPVAIVSMIHTWVNHGKRDYKAARLEAARAAQHELIPDPVPAVPVATVDYRGRPVKPPALDPHEDTAGQTDRRNQEGTPR